MSEVHQEFRHLKTEMSKINTARGGGASELNYNEFFCREGIDINPDRKNLL